MLSPSSPLSAYSSYLQKFTIFSYRLGAAFSPLLNKLTTSPDLASIALLLVSLLASLLILDMVWRAVMYWVRLVLRLVFWASAVGLGLWLWNRGPEGVFEDVGILIGVWNEEYKFWKERAEMGEAWRKQQYGGTREGALWGTRGARAPRWQ